MLLGSLWCRRTQAYMSQKTAHGAAIQTTLHPPACAFDPRQSRYLLLILLMYVLQIHAGQKALRGAYRYLSIRNIKVRVAQELQEVWLFLASCQAFGKREASAEKRVGDQGSAEARTWRTRVDEEQRRFECFTSSQLTCDHPTSLYFPLARRRQEIRVTALATRLFLRHPLSSCQIFKKRHCAIECEARRHLSTSTLYYTTYTQNLRITTD